MPVELFRKVKAHVGTRGEPLPDTYREASYGDVVELLLMNGSLRNHLFAIARERALKPLEPWDETEGPRWYRTYANGPAVVWVFMLVRDRWAYVIDDYDSGVATSKEDAMLMADNVLLNRGWMLKQTEAK